MSDPRLTHQRRNSIDMMKGKHPSSGAQAHALATVFRADGERMWIDALDGSC
jgi:hypothetical protein